MYREGFEQINTLVNKQTLHDLEIKESKALAATTIGKCTYCFHFKQLGRTSQGNVCGNKLRILQTYNIPHGIGSLCPGITLTGEHSTIEPMGQLNQQPRFF